MADIFQEEQNPLSLNNTEPASTGALGPMGAGAFQMAAAPGQLPGDEATASSEAGGLLFDDAPRMMTTDEMMVMPQGLPDDDEETDDDGPDQEQRRLANLEDAVRRVAEYDLTRDAAVTLRDAARLNMSPEEILAAPDFIRKPRLTRDDLVKVSNRFPTVASLLADPFIMAAFGNPKDIQSLGRIEKSLGFFGRMMETGPYVWLRDERDLVMGKAETWGYSPADRARIKGLTETLETMHPAETVKLTDEQRTMLQREAARMQTVKVPGHLAALGIDMPGELELMAAADLFNAGFQGGMAEVGARIGEVGGGMLHSLAQPEVLGGALAGGGVGSIVPGLGTAAGAAQGGGTGLAAVNLYKGIGRGAQTADERGLEGGWRDVSKYLTGLFTAVTETGQFGVMVAPMKTAGKAGGKALEKGAVERFATEVVKRAAAETGLEIVQEEMELAAQDIGTWLSNTFDSTDLDFYGFQEYVNTAWETFKFMALGPAVAMAGAGPGASLPGDLARQRRTRLTEQARQAQETQAQQVNKATADVVKEVLNASRESSAVKDAPEAAGAIIERMSQENGGPQTFHVDAEAVESFRQDAFEQSGLDMDSFEDNFLTPLGLTGEQYQEAVDMGTSLEMKISGLPMVESHPVWAAIEAADGMIMAEPRNVTEERARVLDVANDPFASFEASPEVTADTKLEIEKRLRSAGRSAQYARSDAEIISRVATNARRALGVDANRWLLGNLNRDGASTDGMRGRLNQDVFGEEFADFSGRPAESIEHLMAEKRGYVPGAFYREELGAIDLAWGKDGAKGFGLAHIIERRSKDGFDGEAFARSLPKIIQEGQIETRESHPGRAYIVHEETEAVIRLDWDSQARTWLVTAYPLKKKNPLSSERTIDLVRTYDDGKTPPPDSRDDLGQREGPSSSGRGSRDTQTHVDGTAPPSNLKGHGNIIDELFEDDKTFFQSAFHGSPHRFDRFSMDAMGTGEGNQSYGWGLYFASNREIAERYRVKLSSNNKGQLYEVNIPEAHEMLDWDKPLSEQPEKVRKAAEKELERIGGSASDGERVYREMVFQARMDGAENPQRAASERLNALGIKGIRYLDGNSRADGEGSHNYVVFDDKAIEVLNTYYQQNDAIPRGRLDILNDGSFAMAFGEAADASTAIHESAHLMVEMLRQVLAASPDQVVDWGAFAQTQEDLTALAEWAGQTDPFGEWSREAHEKVARGFETFMMEGKAPTEGLRRIFEKFKAQLLEIYHTLTSLNAPLNDEVRDVFNRMVATEEELMIDSWRGKEPVDMAPEIKAELADTRTEALTSIEIAVRLKRLKEVSAMKTQWRKDGVAEAKLNPHQIMLDEIIKSGGISIDSLRAGGYASEDIASLNRKRPGLLRKSGKVGFDEFAEQYGYGQDSDAFIQSLRDAPTRQQLINDYMAQQEEFFAEYLNEDAPITDEEITLALLEMEAERLKGDVNAAVTGIRAMKEDLKKNGGLKRFKQALEAQAAGRTVDVVSGFNMKDAKAALRKTAAEGYKAGVRAGSFAKYLEMMMKNRINQEQKNYIAKARGRWERFVNQDPASPTAIREGGVDAEFSIQAKQLLNQLGFNIRERGRLEINNAPNFSTFINGQSALGNEIHAPAWIQEGRWPLRNDGTPKTLGQLSFEQFQDVSDTIDSLLHAGRENQNLLAGKNRMSFDAAAKTMVDAIGRNMKALPPEGPEPKSKAAERGSEIAASLRKPEYIIRELDGLETMGPVWEILFSSLKIAEDRKIELGEKVIADLKAAWKDFSVKERQAMGTSPMRERLTRLAEKHWFPIPKSWRVKRHTFEGAPHSLTEAEIVSVFVNLGNLDNKLNLIEGNGFTAASLAEICDFMMARPKLMQAALDLTKAIDQLYNPLAEVHRQATGVKLAKVDPGEITLPNGIKMPGWYFPIVRDPNKSHMAHQQGQASTAKDVLGSMGLGRRSARSGATHQRTGATGALALSLDVINKHVQDTVHDITHRLPVRDIQRLLNREDVREAINSHAGPLAHEQLQGWINWVAKPNPPVQKGFWGMLDWLRRNTVVATLAFSVNTPIMQLMGFGQSIDFVGFKAIASGIGDLIRHPMEVAKFVRDNSPSVRARAQGFDQDIQDVMRGLDGDAGIFATEKAAAIKAAFWGIKVLDYVVVNATWKGAFDKAIGEGKSLEYAREYADTSVRMTQPLASPKDTAAIQRDPRLKGLAMYYTFFSGFHNRLMERIGGVRSGKLSAADLASTVTWTIIIPAMLTWMYQQEELPDDAEDVQSLLWDVAAFSVNGVPVLRDFVSAWGGPFQYEVSPMAQVGKSFFTTGEKIGKTISGEGEFDEALGKSAVRSAGYLFGLPSNQALRSWNGMWQLMEDETDNPVRLFKAAPRKEN